MDFVTVLTQSTASRYMGIFGIVDRVMIMAIYLPYRKDIDTPELARMFLDHMICKCRVRNNIVTNRKMEFTSRFWNRVYFHLSIDHRLSTAFLPQTDGQTEWQTMPWSSTYGPTPTTCRIPGYNCYLWHSLLITIQSITQRE